MVLNSNVNAARLTYVSNACKGTTTRAMLEHHKVYTHKFALTQTHKHEHYPQC
jgi:hypothetical protein